MHILMIAPEPFFEPRGTPFSEYHRIRALAELGHTVDLVTYPFGRDVEMPGLRVFRAMRPPGFRGVRVGPSWAKVVLDGALALTAMRRALQGATAPSIPTRKERRSAWSWRRCSAPASLRHALQPAAAAGRTSPSASLGRFAGCSATLERAAVRRSRVIIVICPYLADQVRAIDPDADVVLIENAPGSGDAPTPGAGRAVRERYGLTSETPLVLYTGTFEVVPGARSLAGGHARVAAERPDARLLLVGGQPARSSGSRRRLRTRVSHGDGSGRRAAGGGDSGFPDAADVLVSPRSRGTNTPLKIYQYLRAGRPIVATTC